ncbi:hypothetical protein RD792_002043 [Penstemon davidsonii]|uniref:BTB domain-containing protein n=1 Tax=Penstemon davidsonii TaxID=160366 RepID=A0ABR0DPZ3_9LAMI|nr:hypothetical protein RD792_002043 [Penstemon davidsonii]
MFPQGVPEHVMCSYLGGLQALLHFIYCDVIPDLDSKCEATIMTQHLLAAANRYGIEKLKSLCEARLSKNIAIDTATTNLALAEQDGYLQLKSKCDDFILLPENTKAVKQTNEFKDMKKTCPSSAIAEFLESLVRVNTKRFLKKLGFDWIFIPKSLQGFVESQLERKLAMELRNLGSILGYKPSWAKSKVEYALGNRPIRTGPN